MFFEQAAEIKGIIIADDIGHLCNVVGRMLQEMLRIGHTQRQNILHGSHAGVLFKAAGEPCGTEMMLFRILLDADILAVVFIEVVNGPYNVIVDGEVERTHLLKASGDQNKQMVQCGGKCFFVVGPA